MKVRHRKRPIVARMRHAGRWHGFSILRHRGADTMIRALTGPPSETRVDDTWLTGEIGRVEGFRFVASPALHPESEIRRD